MSTLPQKEASRIIGNLMNRTQTLSAFRAAGGESWWMRDGGVDFDGMIEFLQDFARVSVSGDKLRKEEWMLENDVFASEFDE